LGKLCENNIQIWELWWNARATRRSAKYLAGHGEARGFVRRRQMYKAGIG
jgi:hypothetical protein